MPVATICEHGLSRDDSAVFEVRCKQRGIIVSAGTESSGVGCGASDDGSALAGAAVHGMAPGAPDLAYR